MLKLSHDWLKESPEKWEENPDYMKMFKFANSVKLTNDVAERGVKLIDDYSKCLTKDCEEKKRLIQVVQNHRRLVPELERKYLIDYNLNDKQIVMLGRKSSFFFVF